MNLRFIFLAALLAAGCGPPGEAPPVSVPGAPRLVSLAPNLTEMIWAAGGGSNLVGRSSACDTPPEARSAPIVGGYGEPSVEMLMAVRPTLILYVDLADKALPARLKERGLQTRLVRCTHLDDIPGALAEVGALAGCRERGEALAAALRAEIEGARAAVSNASRPRVFAPLWLDPLYTAGRGSFVSELIQLAGGQNIGDDVDKPYFQPSAEWVIERNPDVILCFFEGPPERAVKRIMAINAFAPLSAVRNRRVYAGFDLDVLLRPGPRVMQGLERLRDCLSSPPTPEKP